VDRGNSFPHDGIHLRGLPALPGLSRFPELNVRTYVTFDDKPGVYFFSLDAANGCGSVGGTNLLPLALLCLEHVGGDA